MILLLFLIKVSAFKASFADDFIKKSSKQVWKVSRCYSEDQAFRVVPCFSTSVCEKKYSSKDFFCLKGEACGESFFDSALLKSKSAWPGAFKSGDNYILPLKEVHGDWKAINEIVLVPKNVSDEEKIEVQKKYEKYNSIILYAAKEHDGLTLRDLTVKPASSEVKSKSLDKVQEALSSCP